jgi:hypothetical protein
MSKSPTILSITVSPASGSPGTPFTASVAADGTPRPRISYEWRLDGKPLPEADGPICTPPASGSLTVLVTATSNRGSDSRESAPVQVAVIGAAPTLTDVRIAPSGGRVGDTFAAQTAATGDPRPAITYQWALNQEPVAGATGETFAPREAGVVTVRVRATNSVGSVEAQAAGVVVEEALREPAIASLTILPSTGVVGESFRVDAHIVGEPKPTLSYQWMAGDADIPSATQETFVPVAPIAALRARVTARNSEGGATAVSEAATVLAAAVAPVFVSAGSVVGSGLIGGELSVAGLEVTPEARLSYQWTRNGAAIAGATAATYAPVAMDDGALIARTTTAASDHGQASATATGMRIAWAAPSPAADVGEWSVRSGTGVQTYDARKLFAVHGDPEGLSLSFEVAGASGVFSSRVFQDGVYADEGPVSLDGRLLVVQTDGLAEFDLELAVRAVNSGGSAETQLRFLVEGETAAEPPHDGAGDKLAVLPLGATGLVQSLWIGAVTETSITATARADKAQGIALVVSPREDFSLQISSTALSPTAYAASSGPADRRFVRATIGGLQPATLYHIGVAADGVIDTSRTGRFRTPAAGAHSFRFGCASCAGTGSNANTFAFIEARAASADIDFFQHLGDLHYQNINTNSISAFHNAYDLVFDARRQNSAWRSLPLYYMWDDHDYGANNADGTSASRDAAVRIYRDRVPSPPPAEPGALDPVYYAYTRGRIRFVVTDLRSASSARATPDGPGKSLLGAKQKEWFKAQIMAARDSGQAVCWVNTLPWVSAPAASSSNDDWSNYHTERLELSAFISDQGMLKRLFILSGDMHALAYDDGSSARNYGKTPVLHAAALDRSASHKGGPYTAGPFPQSTGSVVNQFGVVDVLDNGGDTIDVGFRGFRVTGETTAQTVLNVQFKLSLATKKPVQPAQGTVITAADARLTVHELEEVSPLDLRSGDSKIIVLEASQ